MGKQEQDKEGLDKHKDEQDLELKNVELEVDEEQVKKLHSWIEGDELEPPEEMEKMMTNILQKFSISIAHSIIINMTRIPSLVQYMKSAEEFIFNADELKGDQDPDDVMRKYKQANRSMYQLLEFTRKFIVQNKEDLEAGGDNIDRIKALLSSFSEEKLEMLVDKLRKGELDS